MSQVRFNLRPNNTKEPHIQLIYRIKGDQKKLVIGTNLHVPERFWNKNSMRIRETKEFPDFITYNAILDRWEESVNKAVSKFRLEGKEPSKIELKQTILLFMKGGSLDSKQKNFLEYFESFIERRKKTNLAPATITLYTNSKKHVEQYQIKRLHNATLEFADLDQDFFINFINYLKSKKLELNTIHKIIKQIRTVLNDALSNGIKVNMGFKKEHTQVKYTKQPKIYLNEDEIVEIQRLELVTKSRLDKVRDLFLIGVWTGLRFSDFIRLNQDHITELSNGREVFRIKTIKTGVFVTVPIKKVVRNIMNKYDGNPPSLSEQKFNEYFKELCKKADIKKRVSRIEKGKQVFYEKHKLVSSHICRRSFATNSFKAGLNPKLIMPITGHKLVKQFMEYICIDEEESVEMVIDNPFFN